MDVISQKKKKSKGDKSLEAVDNVAVEIENEKKKKKKDKLADTNGKKKRKNVEENEAPEPDKEDGDAKSNTKKKSKKQQEVPSNGVEDGSAKLQKKDKEASSDEGEKAEPRKKKRKGGSENEKPACVQGAPEDEGNIKTKKDKKNAGENENEAETKHGESKDVTTGSLKEAKEKENEKKKKKKKSKGAKSVEDEEPEAPKGKKSKKAKQVKDDVPVCTGQTPGKAFQRVDPTQVEFLDDRLKDNSYWAKDGAETGWGAKAQEVLGQVRGRGFRHEKTKKKRGSYRGGAIDGASHSIKFGDDDD